MSLSSWNANVALSTETSYTTYMMKTPTQYSTIAQFTTEDEEVIEIGEFSPNAFFDELEEGKTRFEGKNQYKVTGDNAFETVWELVYDHQGLETEPGEFFYIGTKKR